MNRRRLPRYGALAALTSCAGCGGNGGDSTADEPDTDLVVLRNEGSARRFDVRVAIDAETVFTLSQNVAAGSEVAFSEEYLNKSLDGQGAIRVEAVMNRDVCVTATADLDEFTPTGIDVTYRTRFDPPQLPVEIRGPFEFGSSPGRAGPRPRVRSDARGDVDRR